MDRIKTIANNDRISTKWENIDYYLKANGRWSDRDDGSIYNKDADISVKPTTVTKYRRTNWECVLNIIPGEPITVHSIREVRRGETRHKRDQWMEPKNAPKDVQDYLLLNWDFIRQDKPVLGGEYPIDFDEIKSNPDISVRDTRIRFSVDISYTVPAILVFAPCIEGADADGPAYEMEYPVKHDDLWDMIEMVKLEATEMWHEWNDEKGDEA